MDGGCQSTISWLRIAREMDAIDGCTLSKDLSTRPG